MNERNTIIKIVKSAGEIISSGWKKKNLIIDFKGEINPVTEIDKKVELFITENLKKYFPNYGILTEESNEVIGNVNLRWIIDPLDGTTNFIKGYPFVAISIALEKEGQLVFGVVYNPILEDMFIAEKGCGATYNGTPIHVSGINKLDLAVLGSGFPYDAWQNPDNNTLEWSKLITHCISLRCDGSAALDLCRVACGQFDGYWEKGISPWDIAAGVVIVREAGGIVTDYLGGDNFLKRGDIIAANKTLHKEIMEIVANSDYIEV